ncbi:MAG TPA: helix-turn-helix domain-containing protein [Gaiellaceae bacterium]
MVTKQEQVAELRLLLRRVMRGMWSRRRPALGDESLGRRHVAVLLHVGAEGERSVGQIAEELGLSLPAASTLARELEERGLLRRREDPADRRRTVVALAPDSAASVQEWLARRSAPLERTLAALDARERDAFLKGLRALGDALMEESSCGPERSHHRPPHRRRPDRH